LNHSSTICQHNHTGQENPRVAVKEAINVLGITVNLSPSSRAVTMSIPFFFKTSVTAISLVQIFQKTIITVNEMYTSEDLTFRKVEFRHVGTI
jgi:hypothetical protein